VNTPPFTKSVAHWGCVSGAKLQSPVLSASLEMWYNCYTYYHLVTLWKATRQEQQLYEENS